MAIRVDDGVRERLLRRFGPETEAWLDGLPRLFERLVESWGIRLGEPIPRGSVSVVVRCLLPDGRAAVVKASPDRTRLAGEAAALRGWTTPHVPKVLEFDEQLGALLLEAVEPGTPLDESGRRPGIDAVASLLAALHTAPQAPHPPLERRVAYLFDASAKLYEAPTVVARALYERGRRLAMRLSADPGAAVLLHGDLTPANVLDGGRRGLVAIDPAPCLGDAAFDAVDLVLWRADDVEAIEARAARLEAAIGCRPGRVLAWCTAFAAMAALELAGSPGAPRRRVDALVALAERAS